MCSGYALSSPYWLSLGIVNPNAISKIVEKLSCPVLVDAGIGTASEVSQAMELGCDGVLLNTAIARAKNPVLMAEAMKEAAISGRKAFLAGRIPKIDKGSPSSTN